MKKNKTKILILTGGVYSSLGKGIIVSSIGRILKELGYSVSIMKFDPYLNIDPIQLNPKEHGEIFVTKDGTRTDLDIGNYERFVGSDMNKYCSICSGLIYQEIINNQINNKYNGETIQVIPHVTDTIIQKIYDNIDNNKTDFLIIEIGGTIGDIESIPFYESITRFVYQYGAKNILFSHCVPLLSNNVVSNEIKTKPAQHSIKELRSSGITPQLLFLRSQDKINNELIKKIGNIVLIEEDKIFNAFNVESTYFLVNELYNQNIHKVILDYFDITTNKDISEWEKFTNSIKKSKESKITKRILILGGHTSFKDSYSSVIESLKLASYKYQINLDIEWLDVNEINTKNIKDLDKYDGIINGGFLSIDLKVNKIVFDYFEKSNKVIINYGVGFLNLIDLLINKKEQKITTNDSFISENECSILNVKNDVGLKFKKYNIRRLSKEMVHVDNFKNKECSYQPLSLIKGEYVDLLFNKNNNKFLSISSNPEYNSKPNNINEFYDWFLLSLIK